MNKTLFKAITVFLALTVMSSMAFAWDETEHVKVAPNGKGDLIIFPFYFTANGGWETKMSIVNTSTKYSVVAKVIIRSHYYSEELLDFLIYLTPADVWTGTFKNEGQGALISSTDDSMLVSNNAFASPSNPVNKLLFPPSCTDVSPFDSADYGYVEVVESWYADLNNSVYTTAFAQKIAEEDWRTARPVSKEYLRYVYNSVWIDGNGGIVDNVAANGSPGLPRLNDVDSLDQTINVLAAHMQFQNPMVSGMTSGMRATVFADFDCQEPLDATELSGLQVISARNTIGEIEAALAKDNLAMEYVNRQADGELTAHIMSFPTKLSRWSTVAGDDYCRYINGDIAGAFWIDPNAPGGENNINDFASNAYRCLSYTAPIFDLKENSEEPAPDDPFSGGEVDVPVSSFCEEVNLLATSGFPVLFDEGWVNYNFVYTGRGENNPTDFRPRQEEPAGQLFHYYGAPAIGSIIKFVNGGLKMFESAHTDGEVYSIDSAAGSPATLWYADTDADADGVLEGWLPDYQYYNEMNALGLETF